MEIQIQEYPSATAAHVSGEIDGRTAPQLVETLSPRIRVGSTLLVDMSATTYMSSAGLRSLLLLHRACGARQARLVLVSVCTEIQDVMASTGFLRFFEVVASLGEALSQLAVP